MEMTPMNSLPRRLLFTAFLVAAAVAVAGQAQAQTTVTAKIPFGFSMRGESLPSGSYQFVASGSGAWRLVEMRNTTTGKGRLVTMLYEDAKPTVQTAITFHRFGKQYVLTDITVEGVGTDLHINPTRAEREMASREPVEVVTVLASR
jgi:hypothetical protein